MNMITSQIVLIATVAVILAASARITWAAPIMNNTTSSAMNSSNSSSEVPDANRFDFQYNCSNQLPSANQSNVTYVDFAIGVFILKDYLKGVRSYMNETIAMEDHESFVPCQPPPVNTLGLQQLISLGAKATQVRHLASWYGVLSTYAEYGAGILETQNDLPLGVAKKLTTVSEMVQSVLTLFTNVIGPLNCTENFNINHPTYNDNSECSANFDTLKFAANMIAHLQLAVDHTLTVQRHWFSAASITTYIQHSLVDELQTTWISRHTNSC